MITLYPFKTTHGSSKPEQDAFFHGREILGDANIRLSDFSVDKF